MSDVLVSTVIPTRNRSHLMRGAVVSALSQTDAQGGPLSHEVIIADDDSTDDTMSVAAKLALENPDRVRYVRVRQGTPAGTRNAGAKQAKGEFLAFLDDDDVWLPFRLSKALAVFAERPDASFVYGQVTPTDDDLVPFSDPHQSFPPLPLPSGHPVSAFLDSTPHLNASLLRKEIFDGVGGFDESLTGFEDGDLLIRMVRRHECASLQEPLALMRFHSNRRFNVREMWQRFLDETRARRVHLSLRDAYRPTIARRARSMIRHRGWYVHRFLNGTLVADQRNDMYECLLYALRISPFHAIRSPLFWRAIISRGG